MRMGDSSDMRKPLAIQKLKFNVCTHEQKIIIIASHSVKLEKGHSIENKTKMSPWVENFKI
jgi:hypothetical protein